MKMRFLTPALALAFALSACKSSTDSTPASGRVDAVAGNGASATVGSSVTLTAKVTDATGSPKASVTVHFAVTAGGGSVNPAAATTAADGTASTVLTLG